MTQFFPRTRYALKSSYYFCVAFVKNSIAEFLDSRMENKKRKWTAQGTFNAGVVPLGKCNMTTATERAAKFGAVVSVDVEQAIIFYREKD